MRKCIKCGNFYLSEPDSGDEMCFRCEMEEKDTKIADLEAKLAEKEKALLLAMSKLNIKEHQPAYCKLAGRDCECMGKVEELKQQLEEKEKELEEINREFVQSTHDWKEIVKEKKTEFAIQQLERVKEKTKSFYGEYSASVAVYFIDQIIKELEGETK